MTGLRSVSEVYRLFHQLVLLALIEFGLPKSCLPRRNWADGSNNITVKQTNKVRELMAHFVLILFYLGALKTSATEAGLNA